MFPWPDRHHRREQRADEAAVDALCWSWRLACIGAGLAHVVQAAAGPTESVPRIVHVVLGPPTILTVELLPGQVLADVRGVAHRLAGPLGATALRIETQGLRHVRIELLAGDPLAVGTIGPSRPVASALHRVRFGDDENGRPVTVELGDAAHLIAQGASGSGKSVFTYGVLGQLADAPDVRVVGSDVTGLTLAPWARRDGPRGWHALGTGDPAAHVTALGRVVAEMDQRIADMPAGHDSVPITPGRPLLVVVVEELPGLMRVLSTSSRDLEKQARAHLARILGEGRKAGLRAFLIAQRAEANVIGGFERAQASHAVSFRVDTLAALQMLHADTDKITAAEHATAAAGIALLSAPGVPLLRFRAPHITYAEYCRAVVTTSTQGGNAA